MPTLCRSVGWPPLHPLLLPGIDWLRTGGFDVAARLQTISVDLNYEGPVVALAACGAMPMVAAGLMVYTGTGAFHCNGLQHQPHGFWQGS